MGTVSESSTTAAGTVGWTYSLSNSAAQYLAYGQTATETFTVTVADGYGGRVTQDVTVVVTGTNDTPVATYTTSNTVAEDASITGQLTSTDVDTANTETYTLVSTSSTGSLSSDSNVDMTINTDGSWTFDASKYDELSAGEHQYITVNYKVTDSSGASATNYFLVTVTGVNDVPTLTDPAPEFQQGAASGYTVATLSGSASDLDRVHKLTYSISSTDGTNSTYDAYGGVATWFEVDSDSGALKILSPLVEDAAVNGTSSYTVYLRCTDDQNSYATTAINLSLDLADSTATASLPYDSSNWSFAPSTVGTGYGFVMTSTSDSNLYINIANSSSTVTSVTKELSFVHIDDSSTSYGSVTLANDGTTGTITDSSNAGHNIAITSDTAENVLINVMAVSKQSITGATDSSYDAVFDITSTNYRDDTLKITDAAFLASTFSMSEDKLLITMATGGVKTVTEVEAVKFSDGTTVRVVGADGYASFLEAMNLQSTTVDEVTTISSLGATSHAADGDYIYAGAVDPTSELSDLTSSSNSYGAYLEAVTIGTTDFYVYHG
jgi:VCBS repeat-containing protein